MSKSNWQQGWWIRRVIYAILALALTIAVGGGWISDTQADTWLAQADQVIGILAAVGLGIAATKTHRGSDDPSTAQDVADAARTPTPDRRLEDLGMVINDIRDAVADLSTPRGVVAPPPSEPGDYRALTR